MLIKLECCIQKSATKFACVKVARQNCRKFIGLSNDAQMVGLGRPIQRGCRTCDQCMQHVVSSTLLGANSDSLAAHRRHLNVRSTSRKVAVV